MHSFPDRLTAPISPTEIDEARQDEVDHLFGVLGKGTGDRATLTGIVCGSPFLTRLMSRYSAEAAAVLTGNPEAVLEQMEASLANGMEAAETRNAALAALRHGKNVLALTVGLADLTGRWPLETVTEALTRGADLLLGAALDWVLARHWPDLHGAERTQGFVFLAMGKHGARELNYSSDIDVIALFDPETARIPDGKDATPHFVRVTQDVVKLMQEPTAEGYVFRTDLRLRPDPGATPVALSVDGALSYYEALGQNWERAAMIKARPCAGDYAVGDRFLAALRPFIWRRHLDYAAIADVHAMKRQIHAVKGFGAIAVPGHNVKLGRGGIREIEFFSQTQQLIAGGRAPQLRAPTTRGALGALTDAGWIEANARDTLYRAYRLLRAIEHRLQMRRDEQTHTLPTSDTELDAFSAFCGYTRPQTFFDDLTSCLTAVQDHYAVLFESEPALSSACGSLVFTGVDADPETLETLTRFGFGDPKDAWRTIAGWHQASIPALRTARSREILTALKPVLLDAMQQTGNTDAAFIAFNRFLRQLPAGVQLFSLLKSNPPLLQLLMTVLGTAPRLGLALSRRVALLDALLDPRFFGGIPDRSVMEDALTAAFTDCQSHEDMLDAARIVGQDQKFLVGVRQLTGNLATEVAAGAYSDLAEVLIEKLLAACLSDIERAHGQVAGGRVAVVAMGRLGSREMTAGSDLDLILIYDHNADAEASDGARPLAPSTYFARLTQRLIAALAAPTARGTLYEVDMRLRPSGRSGPVATRVDSFETYQKDQAWVWEHLALTRARPVAGDRDLMARLEVIAETVLHAERDAQKVLTATADMRARLGAEKAPTSALDLKRLPGGLNDIAFIAQALQLTHAAARPMARARNTGAALRALAEAEALSPVDGETLLDAFALFDAVNQRMAVMTDVPFDPNTAPSGAMRLLCEAAGVPDQARLLARIADARHAVDAICDRLFSSGITPDDHGAGAPWTNKETDP